MARIWRVYDGKHPTSGEPWIELPLSQAVSLFELRPQDFVSGLSVTPRFGDPTRDLWYAGFKHLVIEVDHDEADEVDWKPGFYRSRLKPNEAFRRMIQQVLVAELGSNNVLRVEYAPATDSHGDDAIRLTVVLAQDALPRITGEAAINASAKLRERLSLMRDYRTPIIEYATEAELAQDAGP